jgi:hypothetical protein
MPPLLDEPWRKLASLLPLPSGDQAGDISSIGFQPGPDITQRYGREHTEADLRRDESIHDAFCPSFTVPL